MRNRSTYMFVLTGLLLLGLAALDLFHGFPLLIHNSQFSTLHSQLLFAYRLPKLLTAVVAGASLSVCGVMMQTLFRNPLAGPYILGISSGAGLGVALVTMIGGWGLSFLMTRYSIALAAVIGAFVVMALMLTFAHRVRDNVTLLIVGMLLGAFSGALITLIQNFANPDALKLFIVWTFGSISNVGWGELAVLLPICAVCSVLLVLLVKPLNGLLLGENYARGLGIPVERVRKGIITVTCLLAGAVTAFCGPIAFIGVAVPHLSRYMLRTSDHRAVLPMSALAGAGLLVLCDWLSSLATYPLPISSLSSLFAAPVILVVILKKH